VKGIAHITGGGLSENIPRILPDGCMARIDRDTWVVPPVFTFLQTQGNVPAEDMYRTFNMGIGMILVCAEREAEAVLANLSSFKGASPRLVGKIYEGNSSVEYGTVRI
jgi:phosphoribosylformylglycinamidine cyclo-ligase